jgi:hypothetical protein
MTDDELRALVRDAVARHLDHRPAHAEPPAIPRVHPHASAMPHASHVMYLTLVNEGDACLIEPTVACNHCGYCKSHGH